MKQSLVWFGLCLLAVGIHFRPSSMPMAAAQGAPEQEILRLVNELRGRNGLAPFVWDGRLAAAAQNQASYMAANNIYSHTGAGGSTPQSRARAAGFPGRATENIVGGTGLTPGQGVIWWQNSPVHLNTLLSPNYTNIGIASAQGFDQNFYALVAGSPADAIAAGVPQAPQPDDQLLAPVAPVVLSEPREDGSVVHVVDSGQSFWAIAARYEVPLEQLYLFNNLNEGSVINPGDELIIRLAEGQEPPPTPTPPPFHTVRDGDSWWTIAAWHKLSVDEILWLNTASDTSLLQPGDQVRIRLLPGESPPPTSTPQLAHIVTAGETAWDIAIRYGLDLGAFLAANELGPQAVLSVGDELLIVTMTATPSETPTASSTPEPQFSPTPVATFVPSPTPQSLSQVVPAQNDLPEPSTEPAQDGRHLNALGLIASLLLLAAGLVAILFVWQRSE